MRFKLFILAVLIFAAGCIFTLTLASQTGASLEAEIQNSERAAARQGASPAERHEALVRLARLRQLSGDIEGAARTWLDAAGAIPGRVDDEALLNCAYCLAAMGEWDRAITALEPLLSRYPRARFLHISIQAIKSGDTSSLAVIADNPEYSEMRSEIFFVLWKLSTGANAERWRQRLVTEFPNSPEGRLAINDDQRNRISHNREQLRTTPFWLFLGGLDSLPLLTSEVTVTASARLQTGIFGREANAQAQAASLRNAGFAPTIEQRTVNNAPMWAVTVPAGSDQSRTVSQLRSAGFDAFLVN